MRRPFLRAAVCVSVLWSAVYVHAQAPDPILKAVDNHYNHLTSLKAAYTEHFSGLGMDRTETGTLLLRKPGRMRWMYSSPAGKVFVLDGRYAWSYTPGDAQVQRIAAKRLDDLRSPLRLLLGHTQLERELASISVTQAGGREIIRGIPRGLEQRMKQMVLTVEPTGVIDALRIEEIDGSVTEFTFSEMEENRSIPESAFSFTPPAGVAVVDGLPPV